LENVDGATAASRDADLASRLGRVFGVQIDDRQRRGRAQELSNTARATLCL
jgi:hypothetical protein